MQIFDLKNNFSLLDKEVVKKEYQLWIYANKEEIEEVIKEYDLNNNILLEFMNKGTKPSKIIIYDKCIYLSLNLLQINNKRINCEDIDIIYTGDKVITILGKDFGFIEELINDIHSKKNCGILKDKTSAIFVFYYVIDRVIVNNYEAIAELEIEADKIEISILKNPMKEHVDKLISFRRQVYTIRKNLNPMRYIGDSLTRKDNKMIENQYISYFSDLKDRIDKLMDSLDNLVQDLALVREAFESEVSNKTNEIMKVFTIVTSIFLPLNLITSMQGMNFKKMPLIKYDYGYFYMLLFMIVISIILIIIFKKKKWL
ncbi:magnesium transporter CorA family protein [Clostridium sp. DL1XJH146]